MVAWTMDWSRFLSLFNTHGKYRGQRLDESLMRKSKKAECGVAGAGIIWNPTHFFFVDFYKIQGHPSGLSMTREMLVPYGLLSLHLHHPLEGCTMLLSAPSQHQPTARKEHLDDIELTQECTVRIREVVCRLEVVEAIEHQSVGQQCSVRDCEKHVEVRRARRDCSGPSHSSGVCSSIQRRTW